MVYRQNRSVGCFSGASKRLGNSEGTMPGGIPCKGRLKHFCMGVAQGCVRGQNSGSFFEPDKRRDGTDTDVTPASPERLRIEPLKRSKLRVWTHNQVIT
jgi:hypothetical protein